MLFFWCSILILDELEIYHWMQFCIWDFLQTRSPSSFLVVSGFFSLAAELLLSERFFTCCKDWSFQGNCCQHKHWVRFWAFTEQNVEGFFNPTKQRRNLCTGKTLAEYLRDGWNSKDICYRVPGGKCEDGERKENWSSQSSGSSDLFS